MEEEAARWLMRQGCRILARQYRTPYGELDLVVQDGETLVFAEVKYRGSDRYGTPAAAVDWNKQRHLTRSALWYCQREGVAAETALRFDVIEMIRREQQLLIRRIPDAFEARI